MPTPQNENITRWVMDGNFRKEQERLKIPLGNYIYILYFMHDVSMSLIFVFHTDPILWSKAHIQH
jgi:hypothetical protein